MQNLVVILGPTASGKTELALAVAAALNGEIISGDSVQVYRKMNIGSAKLPENERCYNGKPIKHYLIDIKDPDEDFTVADFKALTKPLIEQINSRGLLPILTGGTGYYLQSVYQSNMYETLPPRNKEYCEELKKHDPADLHKRLCLIDAEAAEKIHENDIVRVIRALDLYDNFGITPTEIANKTAQISSSEYKIFKCGIEFPREILYKRIDDRVEAMIDEGLIDEVKILLSQYPADTKALGSIGYKQICEYLEGKISFEEAIYLIKRDTRHYAKRQLTWFRREKDIHWYKNDEFISKDQLYAQAVNDIADYFSLKSN